MQHREVLSTSFTLLYCPFTAYKCSGNMEKRRQEGEEMEEDERGGDKEDKEEVCDADTPFLDGPFSLLQHLQSVHGMQIERPEECLPFLDRYLQTVVERIRREDGRLCFGGDGDAEDREIRLHLQRERLKDVLAEHVRESRQVHKLVPRTCLFCDYTAIFADTFQHMFREHRFNIGQLHNLVMVTEFLDLLEDKLKCGICLYCEQTIMSDPESVDESPRQTVLQHMRSRQHFKIHSRNHLYDRFYISNYVTIHPSGGDTPRRSANDDHEDAASEEAEADDGQGSGEEGDGEQALTSCPFCTDVLPTAEDLLYEHIPNGHPALLAPALLDVLRSLPFMQRIQLANYLRHCQHHLQCFVPACAQGLDSEALWMQHLSRHSAINVLGFAEHWQQPQYLFPAYGEQDDPLLFILDLDDQDDE
jgi:hypothetical protein